MERGGSEDNKEEEEEEESKEELKLDGERGDVGGCRRARGIAKGRGEGVLEQRGGGNGGKRGRKIGGGGGTRGPAQH